MKETLAEVTSRLQQWPDDRWWEQFGNPELDAVTCRLIQQRYRFRPSLDPGGRPVRSQVVEDHSWVTIDDPEPPREQRRRRRLF